MSGKNQNILSKGFDNRGFKKIIDPSWSNLNIKRIEGFKRNKLILADITLIFWSSLNRRSQRFSLSATLDYIPVVFMFLKQGAPYLMGRVKIYIGYPGRDHRQGEDFQKIGK